MVRSLGWLLLGVAVMQVSPVVGSPVAGQHRIGELLRNGQRRLRLEPGSTERFSDTFLVNQRACVMVEGDHDPVTNLTIRVIDSKGTVVAEDKAGGDFVFVTWYPPKTQAYQIEISSDGKMYNNLDVVVK
jgi:hypothetical protein